MSETQTMKPSQVLRECGWCQQAYHSITGQVCLVGAMALAYPTSNPNHNRFPEISRQLRENLKVRSLTKWNDHPDRTKAEVIAALEAIGE